MTHPHLKYSPNVFCDLGCCVLSNFFLRIWGVFWLSRIFIFFLRKEICALRSLLSFSVFFILVSTCWGTDLPPPPLVSSFPHCPPPPPLVSSFPHCPPSHLCPPFHTAHCSRTPPHLYPPLFPSLSPQPSPPAMRGDVGTRLGDLGFTFLASLDSLGFFFFLRTAFHHANQIPKKKK